MKYTPRPHEGKQWNAGERGKQTRKGKICGTIFLHKLRKKFWQDEHNLLCLPEFRNHLC